MADDIVSYWLQLKKSNELFSLTYSHLLRISITGVRFFIVNGPWDRPDMAYFMLTKGIKECKHIKLFNGEDICQDLTFISGIIETFILLIKSLSKRRHKKYPSV